MSSNRIPIEFTELYTAVAEGTIFEATISAKYTDDELSEWTPSVQSEQSR